MDFFEFHRSMDGVEDLYYHEIGQYGLKYAYLEEEVYAVKKEDTEYPKLVYADNPYLACAKYLCLQESIPTQFVKLMCHAIGLENCKLSKYKAYRNYYDDGNKYSVAWEFLEHKGFAKHVKNTTYRITDKGIQYIEDLFDIQILV
ncbi:MAG: hypothetical protein N4Q79_05835 [Lactobacillus iners]|nr:hypothetical protein [Lactobacillus iners]